MHQILAIEGARQKTYSGTMYHGSATPVTTWHADSVGQFGKGLYLALDRSWAEFHARGGRQGKSGQTLKEAQGFIYEFSVKGQALTISNEEEFLKFLVSDCDAASDAFEQVGDVFSKKVTRCMADYARDLGFDLVIWDPKNPDVLTPFPQAVILNENVAKLKSNGKNISSGLLTKALIKILADDRKQTPYTTEAEDWLWGDCAYFAAALHRIFHYRLEAILAKYSERGLPYKSLGHAYAVDSSTEQAYDFSGEIDAGAVEDQLTEDNQDLEGYDTVRKTFKTELDFWKEAENRGSKKDEVKIKKAMGIIKAHISKYGEKESILSKS